MPGAGDYIPTAGRARAVTFVFVAFIVLQVVAAIYDADHASLYDRIAAGEVVSDTEADAADARQNVIGWVQDGAYLVAAIVFIRWLHLAYGNLDVLGARRRYGRGWAIGAWFVPLLNLVRPPKIVNDVWRGATTQHASPRPLVIWWWITFLADWLFARSASGRMSRAATPEEVRSASLNFLASDVFSILPLTLAILVVRSLSRHLDARGAAADAPAVAEPPGAGEPPFGAEPRTHP